MALSANALPANLPSRVLPLDVNLLFAQAQTFTASGYLNNGAGTVQINLGAGRIEGYWVLDILAMTLGATNQYYFALIGSNDPAFGAGNGELLAFHDFAGATTLRVIPSLALGTSPAVPVAPLSSTRHVLPYTNFVGNFVFQYVQAYVTCVGTTPSVQCTSWLTMTTGAAGL